MVGVCSCTEYTGAWLRVVLVFIVYRLRHKDTVLFSGGGDCLFSDTGDGFFDSCTRAGGL